MKYFYPYQNKVYSINFNTIYGKNVIVIGFTGYNICFSEISVKLEQNKIPFTSNSWFPSEVIKYFNKLLKLKVFS